MQLQTKQFTRINNFVTVFTVTFYFRNIVLFATFGTNSNKNVIVITSRRQMMLLRVEYQFFDEKSEKSIFVTKSYNKVFFDEKLQ